MQSSNNSRTIRSHSSNSISNLSSPIINKNIIREYNEDVFYCYDLTDYKESLWYGVVLRNLDENCNKDRLKEFCQIITSGVLYTTTPEKVMNSICSIVVTYDLDDAEKICVFINNQKKKLKANIHPNSCKLRRFPEKSHFSSILAKNNEDNCTDQVDREDIMSIRKSIDNSSNTFILDDTIRSIYSADDLMIINNRKFSQLHQLVDVSRRNIPNEETPSYGNNCNTNYDHFQDNIIENRSSKLKYKSKKKIKDDQKTNSIITDKPTSPIRGTNSVENMVTKDLKFSNVFISPINDVNINNKKPSSSCDILNCKKRKRDVTTIQSTEAEINTHKSQTIHKEKEINSHSSYDKLDSLKINHEIPPSVISKPSNLVIKNIHLNSNRNIVNIYNPFKDTFNLGNFTKQNSNGKIIQSSYYSSLQKMPGDTKKPKFNSKSSKDI